MADKCSVPACENAAGIQAVEEWCGLGCCLEFTHFCVDHNDRALRESEGLAVPIDPDGIYDWSEFPFIAAHFAPEV